MEWKSSSTVYPVADVAASIDWYRRVFEFEPRIVNPPGDDVAVYAVLYRGGVSIHLLRKDEAPHGLTSPVQTQFWVDGGLDELFQRVQAMGVTVLQSPQDRPWGHRDFMIADPDQNVVWVTVPLAADGRAMQIQGIDHVQLAMPAGDEAKAREFYSGLLGIPEVQKPETLAHRGGAWFQNGQVRIHLGVESNFRPALKAHPALLVRDLRSLVRRLGKAGVKVVEDDGLPGYDRVYVSDPFGNRLELMEAR